MADVHLIKYGSKQFYFNLNFADRKSLGIKIHPSGTLQVIAPINATIEDIKFKVHKKASWILKQQATFTKYNPKTPERKYVNGETHLYLGRQYLLDIRITAKAEPTNFVKISRGKMIVLSKSKNPIIVKEIIEKYYLAKAIIIFNDIFNASIVVHKKFINCKKELRIKKMLTRWGTCSTLGKITLNLELIKAPKASIEYVIIHELCHLVHFNHQLPFYALLNKLCPDWQKRKDRLEMLLA